MDGEKKSELYLLDTHISLIIYNDDSILVKLNRCLTLDDSVETMMLVP